MSTAIPVITRPIAFEVDGTTVRGEILLPAGDHAAGSLPGVVCAGTWTSVRGQMTDRYARRLAAEGFAALSFDFRSYGESDGEPRQIESWRTKVPDITAAAGFLGSRPEVRPGGVAGLAICASAMYMAHAIATGAPIRAFATSAAWIHDPASVGRVYGGDAGVADRIARARDARREYERSGTVRYVPAESPTDEEAAMTGLPFYEDPARGLIPAWTNRFAVMQWEDWLTLDGIAPAARITVPTLLVHSGNAAFPDNARRFHAALAGPKAIAWLEGEHTAFYDQEPQVGYAAGLVSGFLRAALAPDGVA